MSGRVSDQKVKTYLIEIEGYSPVRYCARTMGKARYRAFVDFSSAWTVTFTEFVHRLLSCRRVANSGHTGERRLIAGEPATLVEIEGRGGIYFMRDGSDVIMSAHPMEVKPLPPLSPARSETT